MRGVSIIVCCFNSQERLPATLKSLIQQKVAPAINWEVIIIDNASTDNTSQIAATILALTTVNYKIVSEYRPGLSFARQAGAKAATFDYIIFCDDDNWLAEDYINIAYNIMVNIPAIGAAGGQSIAVSTIDFPLWWDDFKDGYAVGKQADETGYINKRGYVWGAGLITRKDLFLQMVSDTYPSILTDRKGSELTSGGDSEYCKRLLLQGYELYYDESLVFKHFIAAERLTELYRIKLYEGFKESVKCLLKYDSAIQIKNMSLKRKFKMAGAAFLNWVKCTLTGKQPVHYYTLVLFYFFNVEVNIDKDHKLIKHFYNKQANYSLSTHI